MFGVPLFERGSIDLYNTVFNKGFGSHQLIVGGVVNHINDFSLFGNLKINTNSKAEINNLPFF
jgi:hypothetical protein